MTEYWKSNPRKFCDTCQCWIADQKASIEFHENGKKHQINAEKRLNDIRKRSVIKDKKAQKEAEWIEQMEAAALKDYRHKDLAQGADLSARMFHEQKADREAEKEAITATIQAQKAQVEANQRPPTSDSPEPKDNFPPDAIGPSFPQAVAAPKSGTQWHKDPKKWMEALSEQGRTFFWHVETKASRWDPPPEGYLSVAEQAAIHKKKEENGLKRLALLEKSKAIHGEHKEEFVSPVPLGADGRPEPYGSWQVVERVDPKTFDFQTPTAKAGPQPTVTLHNDRDFNFKTKATPSLGGSSAQSASSSSSSSSGIVFKKRKMNSDQRKKNMRTRTDD